MSPKTLCISLSPRLLVPWHCVELTDSVSQCDEYFDPKCQGNKTMRFTRSKKFPGTGESAPPKRILYFTLNSQVSLPLERALMDKPYGCTSARCMGSVLQPSPPIKNTDQPSLQVDKETTDKLRTFKNGKLKVNERGHFLPLNTMGLNMHGMGDPKNLFAAGDPRANQDYV